MRCGAVFSRFFFPGSPPSTVLFTVLSVSLTVLFIFFSIFVILFFFWFVRDLDLILASRRSTVYYYFLLSCLHCFKDMQWVKRHMSFENENSVFSFLFFCSVNAR